MKDARIGNLALLTDFQEEGLIFKDEAEPARLLTHEGLARAQHQLVVQEAAMEQLLLLICARVEVLGKAGGQG